MTETNRLLEIRNAKKSFLGVQALKNVDLNLNHGEVLALVGENGAGKSTLMKLLSGIYTPDSGEFILNGEKINPKNPKHAAELGISIIHQEFSLMPDLSVAQNIFLGKEPRKANFFLSENELNKKAEKLFKNLDLELNPKAIVSDLSVAQQQMVEIAKALSYEAKVLIMDEPSAALNDNEVAKLFKIINNFLTPSRGVIYISHRMDELPIISSRITVIRDGESVGELPSSRENLSKVISLMVGRELSDTDTLHNPDVNLSSEIVLKVANLNNDNIHDINFNLHKGEILGFAGLMGSGRTELARAIVGADSIKNGEIFLNNRKVKISSPHDASKLGIGYLSEDRKQLGLLIDQSVSANISISNLNNLRNALGIINNYKIEQISKEQIKSLNIKTPNTKQEVQYLSGGNQQKVVIARWLERDSKILIFDEPTRGIDVGAKEEIYALLKHLAQVGKSIIVISSDLPEVLRVSDRIAVMSNGRIKKILNREIANAEVIMQYATEYISA